MTELDFIEKELQNLTEKKDSLDTVLINKKETYQGLMTARAKIDADIRSLMPEIDNIVGTSAAYQTMIEEFQNRKKIIIKENQNELDKSIS